MPTLAAIKEGAWGKASPAMKSDIVNPIPARHPTAQRCDQDTPGLYVEVRTPSQNQTYYLRFKNDIGKTCHQRIGRTTEVTLAEARRQAKKLKAEIALGKAREARENPSRAS